MRKKRACQLAFFSPERKSNTTLIFLKVIDFIHFITEFLSRYGQKFSYIFLEVCGIFKIKTAYFLHQDKNINHSFYLQIVSPHASLLHVLLFPLRSVITVSPHAF